MRWRDKLWHGWLRQPYKLYKGIDVGSGQAVVFLHGIGRSSRVWQHIFEAVQVSSDKAQSKPVAAVKFRMLAYDLLGFGQSPKPEQTRYTTEDHAKAVIAALTRLPRRARPVILVGHSMGCLVAVHVARVRPDLVKHLILYEMPMYEGLPDKRIHRARLKLYFNLYNKIVAYRPILKGPGKRRAQKVAEKIAGFTLDDDTWVPFMRSLKHTIMEQTAHQDMLQVRVPIELIYGKLDQVVIRGKVRDMFGADVPHVTAHAIFETHAISRKASKFLLKRINEVLKNDPQLKAQ
jgi:pimeloyl-ACP methyl ester carboxylesterase